MRERCTRQNKNVAAVGLKRSRDNMRMRQKMYIHYEYANSALPRPCCCKQHAAKAPVSERMCLDRHDHVQTRVIHYNINDTEKYRVTMHMDD